MPTEQLAALRRFVTDDEAFSVEHFIISESKSHETIVTIGNQEYTYKYEDGFYKKYVNSMFNYIFIPQAINGGLENRWLPDKLGILQEYDESRFACQYSQMIIEKTEMLSKEMSIAGSSQDSVKDGLDLFFARDYKEIYVIFARDVLKEVMNHIKQN